ncbi:MAG: T9SS type A sorting domain-containing protein [Bacteroidota bacterium]|nr:T9SS type A sorting domain-containing protein [Bacteroidota bacterium]
MNRLKCLLSIVLICIIILRAYPQAAIGEWTDYQSYAHATNVVDAGDKVYCVTGGGMFSYNKTDNSIQKMSGINGLSDVGIQRLAYSKENNLLLIAYQNANIDLIIGNEIFNLSDIKRKQIAADKTINNVMFSGNLAYLSCGFGIVVVNLEKKEIKDTYFIGNEGDYLNVQDMATDGDNLYAATVNGIFKAKASEPNLQNYSNWSKQTSIPHANQKFSKIEFFKGKIIANYTPDQWASDEMYQLDGEVWTQFLPNINYISDITTNDNFIVFSSRGEVFVYNDKFEQVNYIQKYSFSGIEVKPINTLCAVLDQQNILWIADQDNGLIKVGTQTERIVPEGPADNRIFSLTMSGQDLWVTSGGRDNAWDNLFFEPQFQLYRTGKWSVFNRKTFPDLSDFRDMVCVTIDPKNPDHVFAGSWGGGVLEFNAGKFMKQYNNFNSTLQTQLPNQPAAPYVRIGGMSFDSKGNLWVTNSGVAKVISEFQPDGTWKAFELPEIANKYSIGKIVVTQDDDKWLVVARGHGLYVVNNSNNQSKSLPVIALFKNSEGEFLNPMNDVYSLAEDLKGEIWVGTSTGVAVFSNPQKIWTESVLYATRPGLNLNDGFFHPLLEKETITAIAIDGANRKWFGTKTSGLFLISADGETEIEHFNSENSPLPSNEITDIAINQQTGEVFAGTAAGLISYMGEATTGNAEFSDVYVYPNPVRENYEGPIVVKGLVEDTDVKITDISGDLVYKTTSLGGQATWDGRNLNGNRCKTGVYLIFMTDPTGGKTKITKLLFIH